MKCTKKTTPAMYEEREVTKIEKVLVEEEVNTYCLELSESEALDLAHFIGSTSHKERAGLCPCKLDSRSFYNLYEELVDSLSWHKYESTKVKKSKGLT